LGTHPNRQNKSDPIYPLDSAKFSRILGTLFSRKRSVYTAIGFSRVYPGGWANSENARKSTV
jgi:hypothetical protein